jgi:hypothetical protein
VERFCYLSIEASSEIVGGGTAAELTTLYCVPWPIWVSPKRRVSSGQRSIQIDGLRVPCVSLQTPGWRPHQHGLVFRSWRYHISKGGSEGPISYDRLST